MSTSGRRARWHGPLGCAVALALTLPARAAEGPPPPEVQPGEWYGWQTLAADAASRGLVSGGLTLVALPRSGGGADGWPLPGAGLGGSF